MENINLQIHNYKYSKKQIKDLESKLEMFIKQIPCNSRVLLDFNYKDKVFYGKLRVDFSGKSFFAKASGPMIVPLTGLICKKMQKTNYEMEKNQNSRRNYRCHSFILFRYENSDFWK